MANTKKALKKVKKVKVKKNPYIVTNLEIDIPQLLLHSRQLFLTEEIDEEKADYIIKGLIGLAEISDEPILLWINSPGGSVIDGFSIIDAIKSLKAPVYTSIIGQACSMAGLVLLAGEKRAMTENSIFMAHEMTTGGYDYAQKVMDKMDFVKELNKKVITFLANNSKMTQGDLEKAQRGELWLNAKQCCEKGIVDFVIRGKNDNN